MRRLFLLVGVFAPIFMAAQGLAPFILPPDAIRAEELQPKVTKALRAPLVTIVDKARPSPSGDPHDYISYGRYYWPDPSKPDGLPYLQKDGYPNREQIEQGDGRRLEALESNLETLALGWARFHREDCSRRAGEWLRAWFVAPATRINPAFNFAQIRLGRDHNRGSGSGLIDTRGLVRVIDAVRLLHGAPGVTADDERAVRDWFSAYLSWLLTSPQGKHEHAARNNHGSWFLVQLVTINRFLGRADDARKYAREDLERIGWQVQPDGRQLLEIARTDGLSYSVFNLEAQLQIALVARPLGVELWDYQAPSGGSLRKALDYLRPFDGAPQTWPHAQLAAEKPGFLKPTLALAARLSEPASR